MAEPDALPVAARGRQGSPFPACLGIARSAAKQAAMFIPENAMGGLPSAAAASSMGYVEQVTRHYHVASQLSKDRVARLARSGEQRVAQLIRWVNEDDRGEPGSISQEAVLRAQRGNLEVYEMVDKARALVVMKGVLRLEGTSCAEVLSLLSAKEPTEVDAALEDLLGPMYTASACLHHADVDIAKLKGDKENQPPAATAPVKSSLAVQWLAVKDAPRRGKAQAKTPPLREFFFMRFNQSFATALPPVDGSSTEGAAPRPRVSYGVSVWESIDLPTCVPLFPAAQMQRCAFRYCGFVVEASETPGSNTTRVSFFVTAPLVQSTLEHDAEWLLRVAEGVRLVPSALVNRRIRRNQLRDRRHWAYSAACAVCSAKFGLLAKKHHCRICGGTVCSKCSEMRSDLRTSVLTASARVCRGCLNGDSLTPWGRSTASSSSSVDDLASDRGSIASLSSFSWATPESARANGGRAFSDCHSVRSSIASSTYSDADPRDRAWSIESFGAAAHIPEAAPTSPPRPKAVRSVSQETKHPTANNQTPVPRGKLIRSTSTQVGATSTALVTTNAVTTTSNSVSSSVSTAPSTTAGTPHHSRGGSHDNYPVPAYQRKVSGSATPNSRTSRNPSVFSTTPSSASRSTRGVSSAEAGSSSSSSRTQPTMTAWSRGGTAPLTSAKSARSLSHETISRSPSRRPSADTTASSASFDDSDDAGAGGGVSFTVYQVPGAVAGRTRATTRGRSPISSSSSSGGGLTPKAKPTSPASAGITLLPPQQTLPSSRGHPRPPTTTTQTSKTITTRRTVDPRLNGNAPDARNGTSTRGVPAPQPEPTRTTTQRQTAGEGAAPAWGYPLTYKKGHQWPDAPIPDSEAARLERIKTLNLSQHFTNTELRELLQFATATVQCPVGVVSVVAVSTSLLVTTIGLRGDQLPRDMAPDAHVLMSPMPTVVLDTREDARFANNPLVTSTHMRFFLGIPLIIKDSGVIVGALSLMDTKPRDSIKAADLSALTVIASRIVDKMDARNNARAGDNAETTPRTGVLLF